MTSKASNILLSVMSSIDDIKDKINDGEYLKLCNLLKSLNEELKNPSDDNDTYSSSEEREEEEEESEEIVTDGEERELDIDTILKAFMDNPYYFDDNGAFVADFHIVLNEYNDILKNIEDMYNNRDNHVWFNCMCGKCVRTADISEHITTPEHAENIAVYNR